MKRLLALTLTVSVVNAPVAFAGEGLLESASRVARETARAMAVEEPSSDAVTRAELRATVPSLAATVLPAAQGGTQVLAQEAPGLEASGMSKGRKVLIALAVGVIVAGTMYAIDHKVEDNTPSSHGLREDLN